MDSLSGTGLEICLVAVCSFDSCAIIVPAYHVGRLALQDGFKSALVFLAFLEEYISAPCLDISFRLF